MDDTSLSKQYIASWAFLFFQVLGKRSELSQALQLRLAQQAKNSSLILFSDSYEP